MGRRQFLHPSDGALDFNPSDDLLIGYTILPSSGTAANGKPIFSYDQAAAQIDRDGGWNFANGASLTITYAFRSTAPANMPEDTSGFSRFSSAQIGAAQLALQEWAAVANITFVRVGTGTIGANAYSNAATILFANYSAGAAGAAAFTYLASPGQTGPNDLEGDVWVNSTQASNQDFSNLGYGEQTLVHEIGHALGLEHPGDYNASADPNATPTYATDAEYWQDSRMFTVMSYFGSDNTGGSLPGYASGPQLHDIAAIQLLYGANMNARSGDTVYGFNSNTGDAHFSIANSTAGAVFSIWDTGGNDTLDLSGYSTNSTIDLRPESFSSAGPGDPISSISTTALYNISIARGVIIENAIGGSGNDTITGNDADNTLDGRTGADSMAGGLGNDTYVVDNVSDTVIENLNAGIDTVLASVTYGLASNVENLTLTGIMAINATGNELANTLTGNVAANVLDGGAGADTMIGGLGNDTYIVDNAGDVATENANGGTDTVQSSVTFVLPNNVENLMLTGLAAISGGGNGLDNALTGNDGANILDGGAGADHMTGGLGNDTYVVDNVGDVVTESANAGIDLVQSSISYVLGSDVENLTLTGVAAINGNGNALDNVITGNSASNELFGFDGNDTLDGGAGVDHMFGGLGNDTYIVDNADDQTFEASPAWGTDLVLASVTYWLGTNIDNLTLTGSAAIDGNGNDLDNVITGNSASNVLFGYGGNDTIDGGAGVDQMYGGLGNDTYYVDNVNDVVFEASPAWGVDTVISTVSYFLSVNIDNLTLAGSGPINGIGNELNNTILGNAASNQLFGYGGDDILNGGPGADQMYGGQGNDTYYVDNPGDVVFEANAAWGVDTVYSSVTMTLLTNIDNLILTGASAIDGSGNDTDNSITGNAASNVLFGYGGNDVLDGGAGVDQMYGGLGNDTYYVDNSNDVTFEANAAWGTDLVYASASYTLGTNIDNLTLTGSAAINGTGNELDNVITGNSASNTLAGGAGNDTIDGGAGPDTLQGGSGNDVFVFHAGQADGDIVLDFNGQGASAGDSFDFEGYGAGATFVQIDATHWQISSADNNIHDIITLTNGATVDLTDYVFG